jgi:hypothetical protein
MSTDQTAIGSYGVRPPDTSSQFEDEGIGNTLIPTHGIVVSRIEDAVVYVREWSISSHFSGAHALEKFEEAREHYDFDFTFSAEREVSAGEQLDGHDEALKTQLRKQLKSLKN